jgi:hypothetical protein
MNGRMSTINIQEIGANALGCWVGCSVTTPVLPGYIEPFNRAAKLNVPQMGVDLRHSRRRVFQQPLGIVESQAILGPEASKSVAQSSVPLV